MRLINIDTLKLEEIHNQDAFKQYAILSHRWEDEEVSFKDMRNLARASSKKGFAKIKKSCERARSDGYKYVWVDTCCINKESSAELSEGINSMYRWYKDSAVCYALLSDVYVKRVNDGATSDRAMIGNAVKTYAVTWEEFSSQIKSSLWFTRGWTLQELIAPQYVLFFDQEWGILGTKQTLSDILTERTGVDKGSLNGESLSRRSIAQRMSWASRRITTRIEDTAYCLLGIFDVNMPLLYGEGKKAFLRLQEEIIKQSDDHSIFAWPIYRDGQPGLLADSPIAFADCDQIRTLSSRRGRPPYSMTNRGLSIKLRVTPFVENTYLARLECTDDRSPLEDESSDEPSLGIFLRRLNEDDQYARVKYNGQTFLYWNEETLKSLSTRPIRQIEVNVRQGFTSISDSEKCRDCINGFRIISDLLEQNYGRDRFEASAFRWSSQANIMSAKPGAFGLVGILQIDQPDHNVETVALGFDFEYNPVCFISAKDRLRGVSNGADWNSNSLSSSTVESMWTAQDYAQFPDIRQWDSRIQMAWSEVHNERASELEKHSGLWALKGDRLDGLRVQVGDLANLHIMQTGFQDKEVWTVYLGSFRKPFWRK